MTVKMPKDWKQRFTVWEADKARKIIQDMKTDEFTVKEYAEMAANLAAGCNGMEVLQCSAEIAKNCRVWDRFGDDTQQLDVWVSFKAFNPYRGFYDGGAYLSDIWDIDGDEAHREEIRNHTWVNVYKKEF